MTHYGLMTDLIKEIEVILRDVQAKKVTGEVCSGIKGYEQSLPLMTEDEEDESQLFPYFIVRSGGGSTKDDSDPWIDKVDILLGIYDDDKNANGHRQLLTMIQRITDRFAEEPLLNGKFRAGEKMEWALQEEDTFPFYFGGIELEFRVPKKGRRDEWS